MMTGAKVCITAIPGNHFVPNLSSFISSGSACSTMLEHHGILGLEKEPHRVQPHGVVVKCAPSVAGGPRSDTGHTPTHSLSGHAVVASHIKWRMIGTDVRSGPVFLSN